MVDSERQSLEKLHLECTDALQKYLNEGSEMCRLLSAIENHPATKEQRRLLLDQSIKENEAHDDYISARAALFKFAGWC